MSSAGSAVLADALEDLGHTRTRLEKWSAAAEDFALAAELWQALSGETAPQYRQARRWHAVALGKAGRSGEAEAILVEQLAALEERTTSSEEDWFALERVLGDLTRLYRSIGRTAEAQLMEERRNALFRNRD